MAVAGERRGEPSEVSASYSMTQRARSDDERGLTDVVVLGVLRVDLGLVREHVDPGRVEVARLDRVKERGLVDDSTSR